ncbi:MAG: DUF1854 domain-containing protein [Candidatus Poribacteria bacterium]
MEYKIEDELNILDPKKIRLYKDEFNKIRLNIINEKEYPEVKPVMSFPITDSESYVSLYEIIDGKRGKEIGIIENIEKLDNESKKLLKTELKREYFMPRIIKINSMTESHGVMKFDVETDKGRRVFETRYKEDIRRISSSRIIIRDADGNRYEIRDQNELDPRSQSLIDTEI